MFSKTSALVALLAAVVILPGCAGMDNFAKALEYNPNGRINRMIDGDNAHQIDQARRTVAYHTIHGIRDGMIATALNEKCAEGKRVEVFIMPAMPLSKELSSCVVIWESDDPKFSYGQDTLLIDGDELYLDGRVADMLGQKARAHYLWLTGIRDRARRITVDQAAPTDH